MSDIFAGKYKLLRKLGEGGMAIVYEAVHLMLDKKVAIKVLNPHLSKSAHIKDRFKNEAKLMSSLNHPNITKVIDFEESNDQLAIVMEFLEGEDLNIKIRREGALSALHVAQIFNELLDALQYAHQRGVVHRDIKPSNIFILNGGQVKILDFGIAKLFGQGNDMTNTGAQLGTPIYMSPEQVLGEKSIDFRSDIYSLGVTMYFCVNGSPPYKVNDDSQYNIFNKIVNESIPASKKGELFNDLISRACQKDRNLRFQSCLEWKEELIRALKSKDREISKGNSSHSDKEARTQGSNKITKGFFTGIMKSGKRIYFYPTFIFVLLALGIFIYKDYKKDKLAEGIALFKAKRFEDAIDIFEASILSDDADALFYLAMILSDEQFIRANPTNALRLAKKSADQENVRAINLLGEFYLYGTGVDIDCERAESLFIKAADKNDGKAYFNLGEIYFLGTASHEINFKKAFSFYSNVTPSNATEEGLDLVGRAQLRCGEIFSKGGYGMEKNLTSAKGYFSMAINNENAEAGFQLGLFYFLGLDGNVNYYQAFKYFNLAADLNHVNALYRLGDCFARGLGCRKDDEKAFELYQKASDLGDPTAMYELGMYYRYGRSPVEVDSYNARKYFQASANMGNELAQWELDLMDLDYYSDSLSASDVIDD